MTLCASNAGRLPAHIAVPGYVVGDQREGIVHLGIGAFHRGHLAVYTDDAMTAGDRDWRIVGVSLRSPAMRDTLQPQDCLYTVAEKNGDETRLRLIGAVSRVLVAPKDPDAVVEALASADIRVVTITVTEKGYHRDPASGDLSLTDEHIASDLLGEGPPQTIYGFLARALARRRDRGGDGLTILSCDNLPGNGQQMARSLDCFLKRVDAELANWVKHNVAFPDTMVDRLVPAMDEPACTSIARHLGMTDKASIVTEPFRQWVIENRFAGPRPCWEAGGAQLVDDVRPFEAAKLRLLNATHSTLAYFGLALGLTYVHEAIADPLLGRFVIAQASEEVIPTLHQTAGLDLPNYVATMLERFRNVGLRHCLDQIATDGSHKVPQRLLATVQDRSERGWRSRRLAHSLAAWIAFMRGSLPDGAPLPVSDPQAAAFALAWSGDVTATDVLKRLSETDALRSLGGIRDDRFMQDVRTALDAWLRAGPQALLVGAGA